jgi:hypothetical protein
MPKGLTSLGRRHALGSGYGSLLVEIDDAVALAERMAEWANLLELDISPVIEDKEAAKGASRVYKS